MTISVNSIILFFMLFQLISIHIRTAIRILLSGIRWFCNITKVTFLSFIFLYHGPALWENFPLSQEVTIENRTGSGILLHIKNPTSFPAKVSLFAETSADAKKPLSYTAFMKWQKIDVEAGKSCKVEVPFPAPADH